MVANHSAHKRGWDDRWEEYSRWAEKGKGFHDELTRLVDEDTDAFNRVMNAYGLPSKTEADKEKRNQAIQEATRYAIDVPLRVMKTAFDSLSLIKAMAETGNPSLISDAGVGALAIRSAVMGAYLNVKINTVDLEDNVHVENVLRQGAEIESQTRKLEKEILEIVHSKIDSGD
jgi:glutamate formiminotransferase/formiminotetrahydrofolate cyclodeaminase